ncbi:serpentine type 7TM GPCR chemoreceptor srh domain-containing protein [Ditylenchus destructor]|nr:serpentine type 7TM GPCR chemoreceptor srh domain-containing protein [Ditylenchus destructor]
MELGSAYYAFDWVVTGITVLALAGQAYLVYLIIYISPKAMSSYRPFLLVIAFWDALLSLNIGMFMPNLLYPASCILSNGPYKYLGPQLCLIMFIFTAFCAVNGKTAQDYCMMYRLTIILPNQRIHELFMKWQTVVLIQLILWAVSFEICITAFLAFRDPFIFPACCAVNGKTAQDYCMMYRLTIILPNQRIHELFMKWQTVVLIQLILWAVSFEICITAFLAFRDPATSVEYLNNWNDVITSAGEVSFNEKWKLPPFNKSSIIICTDWRSGPLSRIVWTGAIFMATSELFCFVMAASIFGILQKNVSRYESNVAQLGLVESNRILPYRIGRFSRKTYSMHLQLTGLVVAQYLSPIIFAVAPLSVMVYKNVHNDNNDVASHGTGEKIVIAFSLYGFANIALTLTFVAPYRNYTKRKFLEFFTRLGLMKRPSPSKLLTASNSVSLNRLTESSVNNDNYARINERNV